MNRCTLRRSPRATLPLARYGATLALALSLGAGTLLASATPALAQNGANGSTPPLEIRTGFLKSAKFVYRDSEPQKVHGFVSYSEEYLDLLGRHPEALAEANKAKPFFVLGLVGTVGMTAVAAKMLIETISDAQDVQEGRIDSDTGTTSWTDVGLMAGFGAVAVVSALVAKGHVNRSVDLFNRAEGWMPGDGGHPQLSLGLTRIDGHRVVTWSVALPR